MTDPNNTPHNLHEFITELAQIGFVVSDRRATLENCQRVYGVEDRDISVHPPFIDDWELDPKTKGGSLTELIELKE